MDDHRMFHGLPVVPVDDDPPEHTLFRLADYQQILAIRLRLLESDEEAAAEVDRFALKLRDLARQMTEDGLRHGPPVAWRIAAEDRARYGGVSVPFDEVFERFLYQVDTTQVTALVVGFWGGLHETDKPDPVELLVKAADALPELRAVYLGDIGADEQELSWIIHKDVTPLIEAFPNLERLDVRGGGMWLRPFRSERLKTLRLMSGGLPADVVRAVAASDLPALERLDLWLGDPHYGGDAAVADLLPVLSGERLPALRHLGLENSTLEDEIAAAVAGAPIVARLETLSLARGLLTDTGVEALLAGQPLTHLEKLDLHHHYVGERMAGWVRDLLPGVQVDLSDRIVVNEGYAPYVEDSE
ncbi:MULTISPECIES: STM4015 family protein [Thermomonosporaceae]|uniref:STM4015 family protein n=1 Tax=Thermomonosporaceae TaxID=2012 RepID=UPI00255A823E|nr:MULTISPECIES: STM4015 family protein [Thermomonosporaceae]MDL4775120.1 STM4015 family protein [Actinomadura xylanilytica]